MCVPEWKTGSGMKLMEAWGKKWPKLNKNAQQIQDMCAKLTPKFIISVPKSEDELKGQFCSITYRFVLVTSDLLECFEKLSVVTNHTHSVKLMYAPTNQRHLYSELVQISTFSWITPLNPFCLHLFFTHKKTAELKLHLWQSQRLSNVFFLGRICFDAPLITSSDSPCTTRGPTQHCLFAVQSEDQRSQSPAPVIIHPDGNPGLLDTLHLHLPPDNTTHTTVFIEHLCKLWTQLPMK